MSSVVMLIGPPGSGKSTFRSRFLRAHPEYIVVSSDDFIDERARMRGITYSEAFEANAKLADTHCRQVFEQSLKSRERIIVDRTNLTPKSRRSFLAKVPQSYTTSAVLFEVAEDELHARIAARAAATGKDIPRHVLTMMQHQYVAPSGDEFDIITKVVQ